MGKSVWVGRWTPLGGLLVLLAGAPDADAGPIRDWELATPVPTRYVRGLDRYPHFSALFALDWQAARAAEDGRLALADYLTLPAAESHTVLARAWLRAETWQPVQLRLALRDAIVLYWNGRPVFRRETGSPAGAPADSLPAEVLFLTAAPGLNELMLAVTVPAGSATIHLETDPELLPPLVDHGRLTEHWRTEPVLRTPESVLYDPRRQVLYVSNFNAGYDPTATDPAQFTGFLSRLSLAGEILELEWVGQLKAPAGLALAGDGGTLWVVERNGVAQVDVERGEVVARIPLPDADFPNDIVLAPDGVLYVTDTRPTNQPESRIYRIAGGRAEVWAGGPEIDRANGLCLDGDRLLLGNSGDGLFKAVDLAGRRISPIAALGGGIQDGIRPLPEGDILVSHWEGKIFVVSPAGGVVEIADLKAERQNAADYEFLAPERLLVVPTFSGNRVIAYRLAAPAR